MDKSKYEIIRLCMERTAKALRKNNMWAECADNAEDALEILEGLLPEDAVIAAGGSMTLQEIGAMELIRSDRYRFLDRFAPGLTKEETRKIFLDSFGADVYLCSANAITENGELYNVDGNSNRVAAMLYGPESVVVLAGYNKIVRTVDDAVERVKSIAAPANALRLHCDTPCASLGRCTNCSSDDRICANYVLFAKQRQKDRIKVILVGEEYGY